MGETENNTRDGAAGETPVFHLRFASAEDAAAVRAIYGQYIETPITFECALPSEEEFAGRIRNITADYPWILWEDGAGHLAGYAYAHRQMERAAYQWNAELSIYLDQNFTSRGAGKCLYGALMALLRCQGVRTVYGGVTFPNEKSEGLHQSLGFRKLGTYQNTGYKNGKWHDVMWFEKAIAPYDAEPQAVIPFSAIPAAEREAILREWEQAYGCSESEAI